MDSRTNKLFLVLYYRILYVFIINTCGVRLEKFVLLVRMGLFLPTTHAMSKGSSYIPQCLFIFDELPDVKNKEIMLFTGDQ